MLSTFASLSVSGCSPFAAQEPPPGLSAQIPPPESHPHHFNIPPDQIDHAIKEAKLSCDDGGKGAVCPENIAMLIIRDEAGQLSQCTGFLVSPQTLMTNSHCLPKKMRSQNSSCAGIIAVFPAMVAGEPEERVSCESVEFASTISAENSERLVIELARRNHPRLDAAIIRIKSASQRAPVQLNRQGVSARDALNVWTIDPISKVIPGGVMRKKICHPVPDSVLAPDFTSAATNGQTPVAAFSGCEILHGNSGSPAFDRDGKVRALVFATLPSRETNGRHFEPMSLMSNLACVPDADAKFPQQCDKRPPDRLQLDQESTREIKRQLALWWQGPGAKISAQFAFDLKSTTTKLASSQAPLDLIWSEPSCARPSIGPAAAQPLTPKENTKAAPVWLSRFDVNELYQPRLSLLLVGKFSFELTKSGEDGLLIRRKISSSRFSQSLFDRGRKFELPQMLTVSQCP